MLSNAQTLLHAAALLSLEAEGIEKTSTVHGVWPKEQEQTRIENLALLLHAEALTVVAGVDDQHSSLLADEWLADQGLDRPKLLARAAELVDAIADTWFRSGTVANQWVIRSTEDIIARVSCQDCRATAGALRKLAEEQATMPPPAWMNTKA